MLLFVILELPLLYRVVRYQISNAVKEVQQLSKKTGRMQGLRPVCRYGRHSVPLFGSLHVYHTPFRLPQIKNCTCGTARIQIPPQHIFILIFVILHEKDAVVKEKRRKINMFLRTAAAKRNKKVLKRKHERKESRKKYKFIFSIYSRHPR